MNNFINWLTTHVNENSNFFTWTIFVICGILFLCFLSGLKLFLKAKRKKEIKIKGYKETVSRNYDPNDEIEATFKDYFESKTNGYFKRVYLDANYMKAPAFAVFDNAGIIFIHPIYSMGDFHFYGNSTLTIQDDQYLSINIHDVERMNKNFIYSMEFSQYCDENMTYPTFNIMNVYYILNDDSKLNEQIINRFTCNSQVGQQGAKGKYGYTYSTCFARSLQDIYEVFKARESHTNVWTTDKFLLAAVNSCTVKHNLPKDCQWEEENRFSDYFQISPEEAKEKNIKTGKQNQIYVHADKLEKCSIHK